MNRGTGIFLTTVALLGVAVCLLQRKVVRLRVERDRYELNSDALLSGMKRWRVDSATMATETKTLRLSMEEFERYRAEDLVKIEQMGVKIKNLEAAAKHELAVNAPIAAVVRDSVIVRDTVPVYVKTVSMRSPYIQLHGIIERDSLIGSVRLPVTLRQAVWVEYKRRWLFWKRVKAVHQTITSDNPYVEINYSEYIHIKK